MSVIKILSLDHYSARIVINNRFMQFQVTLHISSSINTKIILFHSMSQSYPYSVGDNPKILHYFLYLHYGICTDLATCVQILK